MRFLLSFIVVVVSILLVLFWFKGMSLDGHEVSIGFYLSVIFLIVIILNFILYIFNDGHDEDLKLYSIMMFIPIVFILFPSYNILFGDVNCDSKQNKKTIVFRIAYKDMINDIIYFNNKDKENRGNDYLKNICKDYQTIQKNVEKEAKIDYQDNIVNSLIFDAAYNINYYKIKDIGEKEFNKKQREITNEIKLQIE